MDRRKIKADIILLMAAFLGGFGIIGMKFLVDAGYGTFSIIAIRFFFSSVILLLIFHKDIRYLMLREIRAGIILGLFLFGMFFFLVIGLNYVSPAVNGFLICTQSVMMPFLLWIASRKRPDKFAFISGLISVIGIGILSLTDGLGFSYGAIFPLLGSLSFTLQMVFLGDYAKKFDPIRLTVIENITVFVLAIAITAASGERLPTMTWSHLGNFLFISVFSSVLYCLLQTFGQRNTDETSAAVILSAESVFTALISASLYGERMTWRIALGGTLMVAAIIIVEVKPQKPRRTAEIHIDL